MLTNLIYTSKRCPICTEEEIDKILEVCQSNNSSKDITGVLLYSDDMFLQYLEGDRKGLFGLYDKIKKDKRHSDTMMIGGVPIRERIFPVWNMAKKNIGEDGFRLISGGRKMDKEQFDGLLTDQENRYLVSSIKNFFR